jgi:sec-independent protein translocase protein TatB
MFDLSWSEILIIGVVALIAIGPKELPGVLRAAGQWMGKIRRMAGEFQNQFNEAMREAEMADIKKQVDEMTSSANSITSYDPLGDIAKDFETAIDDKPKDKSRDGIDDEPAVATAPPAPDSPAPAETPAAQDNAETAPAKPEPEVASAQPKAGGAA